MTDSSGDALFVQQGVFRTNCMDCLDRTNVVQSLLAYKTLQHQLQVSAFCSIIIMYMFWPYYVVNTIVSMCFLSLHVAIDF